MCPRSRGQPPCLENPLMSACLPVLRSVVSISGAGLANKTCEVVRWLKFHAGQIERAFPRRNDNSVFRRGKRKLDAGFL